MLLSYFDETDLRTLCFDLLLDYDSLAGTNKAGKMIALIEFCARSNRIGELIDRCSELRPNVEWSALRAEAISHPLVAGVAPDRASVYPEARAVGAEMDLQTAAASDRDQLTWLQFHDAVKELARQLRQAPRLGGFAANVLVGISPGGIIVADLLARQLGGIPVISLWVDRTQAAEAYFAHSGNILLEWVVAALQNERFSQILIVDDVSRTGSTMKYASAFLSQQLGAKVLRTAILVVNKLAPFPPNYSAMQVATSEVKLPWTAVT